MQPKISWYLSTQWSPKHQNKHDSTWPDLHEKFLPSQDLLKSKAGFTETPASYAASTPEEKKKKKKGQHPTLFSSQPINLQTLQIGLCCFDRCVSL